MFDEFFAKENKIHVKSMAARAQLLPLSRFDTSLHSVCAESERRHGEGSFPRGMPMGVSRSSLSIDTFRTGG